MQKGEVVEQVKNTQPQEVTSITYSVEDIAKITNLFSILIKIDQRTKLQEGISNNESKNN